MEKKLPDRQQKDGGERHEGNAERERGNLKGLVVQQDGCSFKQGIDEQIDHERRRGR